MATKLFEEKATLSPAGRAEKWGIFLVLGLFLTVPYFMILHHPLFPARVVPLTPLDRFVPLFQPAIYIYMSFDLLPTLPLLLVRDSRSLRQMAFGLAWITFVSHLFFILWPTQIAMESTGVYWIPLFQILEARGFTVFLVNARHVKNVPGRKSDVSDCQWLQYLHSVGLLSGSFRPEQAVCTVRSILRHRDSLVQMASSHVQHMQKALDQMNLQLHHVISDITGVTGLTIIEAILAGERNPHTVAALRDGRVKATVDTIAKSLVGDYRREHLFTLRQSLAAFRHYQELIRACDREIAQYLEAFESKLDPPEGSIPESQDRQKSDDGEPRFDLGSHLHRIFGVDLTLVPGISVLTTQTLLGEIGPDLSCFANAPAFTSWLGLCPDNRVSGGKVLSVKTRKVKNRAATALRMAAQSLHRSQSYLGHFYRRMRAKLGAPKAITATAHKLARIIYHMLTTRQDYDETICAQNEKQNLLRLEAHLRKQARQLGFQVVVANTGL